MDMMTRREIAEKITKDKKYQVKYLSSGRERVVEGTLDSLHPEDDDLIILIPMPLVIDYSNILEVKEMC